MPDAKNCIALLITAAGEVKPFLENALVEKHLDMRDRSSYRNDLKQARSFFAMAPRVRWKFTAGAPHQEGSHVPFRRRDFPAQKSSDGRRAS